MKIFLDTADKEEIQQAVASGVLDGVTTNPSLLKKAKEKYGMSDIQQYIEEILKICKGKPVSLEVTETSYEGMKNEALRLWKLFGKHKNAIIKIPVNPAASHEESQSFDGIKLVGELAAKGIPVNTTLVFTPEQAVLAAKAGATYVSPFAGRIDDYIREHQLGMRKEKEFEKTDYYPADGTDVKGEVASDDGIVSGVDLVWNISQIFKNYSFKCQVLAASARNTRQVREFMLAGADVTTMPFSTFKAMTSHYKTVEGVIAFERDTVPEYRDLLKTKKRFQIVEEKE